MKYHANAKLRKVSCFSFIQNVFKRLNKKVKMPNVYILRQTLKY